MGKAKRKRKAREERTREALANPQPPETLIDGPDCNPQTIWREHVADYTHSHIEEDGRGWNPRGYL